MQRCEMAMMDRHTRKTGAVAQVQSGRGLRMMLPTLALVAVFWSVSSWGYYALVEALALESGYDTAPLLFTGYYLC